MIPVRVMQDVEAIRAFGHTVQVRESPDGFVHVIIEAYSLPDGYSATTSKLLIKVPASYPNGSPDMFWLEPTITLLPNGEPASTNIEPVDGQSWRRFSWHPKGWSAATSTLNTYLEFVDQRLSMRK